MEYFPYFDGTEDGIDPFVDIERLEVDVIVAHQSMRGSGGRIAVLHETRWI